MHITYIGNIRDWNSVRDIAAEDGRDDLEEEIQGAICEARFADEIRVEAGGENASYVQGIIEDLGLEIRVESGPAGRAIVDQQQHRDPIVEDLCYRHVALHRGERLINGATP